MGIISEELSKIVIAQIHQHGIVVWYDPERQFESIVDGLKIESCKVVKYVDSFFAIRNITDALLNDDNAPRLLIYVPLDQTSTHRALAELESLGVVIQPGQPRPELNTSLSYVASTILRPILGNETSATLEKQIDEGKLSLQNVDELASKGAGIGKGIISVIFGTANVQDITLQTDWIRNSFKKMLLPNLSCYYQVSMKYHSMQTSNRMRSANLSQSIFSRQIIFSLVLR